ncbi:MAG TPA: DUF488 domain-containing protein [Acidimicrobiales bacterium]|jgi:uncharacterized protein (DUF488 family)|nr:DUF488 domain-containing protein [Acidimicrobiales bacterium]
MNGDNKPVALIGILADDGWVPNRIYSVGYEGLELQGLVDHLTAAKVSLVVDVRLNPVSRKRGFSKKSLTTELDRMGIAYRHEPTLGNPQENRESFRRGDGEEGRHRMRAVLNGSGAALQRLVEDARDKRVAVLCVERDRHRCHRQVITDVVQEMDPAIEVLQIL